MRHFTHTFILTLLALIGLTVTINLLVDPYERFNLIKKKGFNAEKYNGGSRMTKAIAVTQKSFNTLIMGTSRSEIGFNPQDYIWGKASVYNLSLPGISMEEVYKIFNYILNHNPPKHLLLSLDLLMFNEKNTLNPEFKQSIFSGKNRLLDNVQSLLNFNTLNQSRKTVRRNIQGTPSYFTPLGQEVGNAVFNNFINHHGQRELFWHELTSQYIPNIYKNFTYSSNDLELLQTIISTCHKENIELIIIIPPIHALQLETILQMHLWPDFEQWKRDLVASSTNTKTPVYDFTSWTGINAENLPNKTNDKQVMQWYWESSHFKEKLGSKVLHRIFSSAQNNFGKLLTPENIEPHLQQQRHSRAPYIKLHQTDVQDLWQILQQNGIPKNDINLEVLDYRNLKN